MILLRLVPAIILGLVCFPPIWPNLQDILAPCAMAAHGIKCWNGTKSVLENFNLPLVKEESTALVDAQTAFLIRHVKYCAECTLDRGPF